MLPHLLPLVRVRLLSTRRRANSANCRWACDSFWHPDNVTSIVSVRATVVIKIAAMRFVLLGSWRKSMEREKAPDYALKSGAWAPKKGPQ